MRAEQKISVTSGGFGGMIESFDAFGVGLASPGDLDGDGICDLAVGAESDDAGEFPGGVGAVWILFLSGPCFTLAPTAFAWDVPHDLALIGFELHVQGQCRRSHGHASGAQPLASNVLELVLGF